MGELKLPWFMGGGGSMGWGLASDQEGELKLELKLPWLCGGGGSIGWGLASD